MIEEAQIVVVGSCMIDLSCFAPRLPNPGETLHGTSFNIGHGGKGANQAVAASKLGAKVALIARLGDDFFGREYLKALQENKIDIKGVKLTEGQPSGIAQITVADNGENQIVIVPGANNLLSKDDLDDSLLDKAKVVICQLETDPNLVTQTADIVRQAKSGGLVILNAAPARPNLSSDILKSCDILCVNETEASMILGGGNVNTILEAKNAVGQLLEKGCKSVILTLGSQGAVYASNSEVPIHVAAPQVQAVDTTGAGDAFIGALAYYLAQNSKLTMAEILKRSCAIAAISVKQKGTQQSFPSRENLEADLFD
ncbi:ribokinase-like [Neocloeon triangulifer]|uniref:ribokinase-like n=1 Tax=Neocloeon triangulifer TaxID=2078957 RepID=UPI00286F2FC1|nr:ribokinase-like [Neocloeon triangulifer]